MSICIERMTQDTRQTSPCFDVSSCVIPRKVQSYILCKHVCETYKTSSHAFLPFLSSPEATSARYLQQSPFIFRQKTLLSGVVEFSIKYLFSSSCRRRVNERNEPVERHEGLTRDHVIYSCHFSKTQINVHKPPNTG